MYQIQRQDILEWAKEYQGEKFHSLLTDAPYHLTSITKRFGKEGSAPAKGDVYRRASAGFMSQTWDGGGISFDPATWAALAELLYPGAFGMTFASPRTHHRIACAIEDAGMIIQPTFYCWLYLSGFPKATRIKGEDNFNGHRYGGQCIKPAVEPVIIFQKPYEGRPVENIVRTGAGALNIDGGRIATSEVTGWAGQPSRGYSGGLDTYEPEGRPVNGRWPANFILTHHVSCNGECHPDCPVRLLDEQAGEQKSGLLQPHHKRSQDKKVNVYGDWSDGEGSTFEGESSYGDSGPASRMFHQATWQYEVAEQLANAEPVRYEPKSSTAERNAGLDDFEKVRAGSISGGGGLNSTNDHAYSRNPHPTVKPLSLAIYLSRLLAPPEAYAPRRLLVPFSGSGSEICGAILSGQWESITGIEQSAEYCKIAEARCKFWESMADKVRVYGLDSILQKYGKKEEVPAGQMSLF